MSAGVLEPILARSLMRASMLSQGGEGPLREAAQAARPARSLVPNLRGPNIAVIAEMKRSSPSAGSLRPDLNPGEMALRFAAGGAAAISVLTEPVSFGGSLEDLRQAASATELPVLRKDFLVDPMQILEARAAGADAVLLIVRALPNEMLERCLGITAELGMTALVEVHDESDMDVALSSGATLIGINNRDLDTLVTDLRTTERLAPMAPGGCLVVSESGIRDARDVERVRSAGASAILVGEALMRAPEVGAPLREMTGQAEIVR